MVYHIHNLICVLGCFCAGALSRGDAELFLRFPAASYREKIWDHAAGAVIVTEAGGRITDAAGAPLDFSRGRCGPCPAADLLESTNLSPDRAQVAEVVLLDRIHRVQTAAHMQGAILSLLSSL